MRIKTKLSLAIGFLFIVIVVFGILSLVSVNRLKSNSGLILKDNYETLVYCNDMLKALDKLPGDSASFNSFNDNLRSQEQSITEPGEKEATNIVRQNFEKLKAGQQNDTLKIVIRQQLYQINQLNQNAIFRKNKNAADSAETSNTWLMVIFTVLMLVTFTLAVNFPGIISQPVISLAEGIRAIVNKDYSKRIHLEQKDEFGELANAYNIMAEKLDEYEHSNLAKIKFEKSRIETIINQMNDGIIGLDEKNNILFLNVVAQKLLGLKQEDIAGKYAADIALKNDLMRTLLQENSRKKELKIYADNKESYFQIEVFKVNNNDVVIGEVILLRNVTPFHELDAAKTNFIATVSHELKTPIAAIKMSTQLLADQRVGNMNVEQQELIQSINNDANRLLKITTELLNMSQLETGHIQLKIEAESCADIVDQSIRSVQFHLQQKAIVINKFIDSNIPYVLADKEKTSWVLINFLTNAIKHSESSSKIDLIVSVLDDKVRFQVKDYGKGMEKKYLDRIFDRYFKIPGEVASSGNGLGLTIAKEFIEAQMGRIWVESLPGVGSTFGFDLPTSH